MKVDHDVEKVNEKFSNLKVDFEDEELAELLTVWAKQNLAPASLHTFQENLERATCADNMFESVGRAVFNEIVVIALEETVKEFESVVKE